MKIADGHPEALLVGQGMTKRYGGVVAVKGVDFAVHSGQIVGLVGPNGAGKTTLVDIISGAQNADSGFLTLKGKTVSGTTSDRAAMGLARTFQHPLLAPDLTILDNLVAGLAAARYTSTWAIINGLMAAAFRSPVGDKLAAADLAVELGLRDLNRLCGDLSLGEQRLVEVARALGQNPTVMLLDEPFAGADSASLKGIIEAIRTVQSRGHGVILVDHNVDLIADLADEIVLLEQGCVAFAGPPQACLASSEMREVYFGGADYEG